MSPIHEYGNENENENDYGNVNSEETTQQYIKSSNNFNKKVSEQENMHTDSIHISIVECSAATGKNVEKVFEKCIHKVLPSKLSQAGHRRTKTTALVTAPIWLRQIVDTFADSDEEGSVLGKGIDESYILRDDNERTLESSYD